MADMFKTLFFECLGIKKRHVDIDFILISFFQADELEWLKTELVTNIYVFAPGQSNYL